MQYMGGKAKIARRIVTAIMADTDHRERWFEPFVGGGNVIEHAAPHFGRSVGMDAHPDLIMMWQAVADGWEPPDFVSREEYNRLRSAEPSALRGYAGFGMSYRGKWWGGYGGDTSRSGTQGGKKYMINDSVRRSVVRQGALIRKYGVRFRCHAFGEHTPPPGTVIYCDPPYRDTTAYTAGGLDHVLFYKTLLEWADSGCDVYVSEYSEPLGVPFETLWTQRKRMQLDATGDLRFSIENLYRVGAA